MKSFNFRCAKCNQTSPRHCPSKPCPWTQCPTHGTLRLTAAQRAFIEGES